MSGRIPEVLYDAVEAKTTGVAKIYELEAPDNAVFPYLVILQVSENVSQTLNRNEYSGRFQIEVWHDDRFAGHILRDQVFDGVKTLRGERKGVLVYGVVMGGKRGEADKGVYKFQFDVTITYKII